MKKLYLAGVVAALALPVLAQAEDKSNGCGLGWQVTNKTSFLATTTRNTTNAFVPPTFGMTSGTLGCAQHSFAKKDEPAVRYLVANYEPVTMQMAEGQGEYLDGLAATMGCNDRAAFGRSMQKNFRAILKGAGDTPFQVFDRVKSQIKQDAALAGSCNA